MPSKHDRMHLLVPNEPKTERYRPHTQKIKQKPLPSNDPKQHAKKLAEAFRMAQSDEDASRQNIFRNVGGVQHGLYVEFESYPGVDLKLDSMESRKYGIELLAARKRGDDSSAVEMTTVFVPDGSLGYFLKKIKDYETKTTPKTKKPAHSNMIDRIADLRRATLQALWTDAPDLYPARDQTIWWEVWLRRNDGKESARFLTFARQIGISVGDNQLAFEERIVMLALASPNQLSVSLDMLNDVAEVRLAKESPAFFDRLDPREQVDWMQDVVDRTTPPSLHAPAVCILDTGVTRGHPLLSSVIHGSDVMTINPQWGGHDTGTPAHGTEMAGLAAYGDLVDVLSTSLPIHFKHRIESVKILPPKGANRPELYGSITAQAVSLAEINAPQRRRVFSMAVTAPDQRDVGRPTSWSTSLDALASGHGIDWITSAGVTVLEKETHPVRRLFIVSAGNVSPLTLSPDYLSRSDIEVIHDPAQAWNVLTVGAYTQKVLVSDPSWSGWAPVANAGDLSPWSTTSVGFERIWPIKPDVVFEGGNIVTQGNTVDFPVPDLSVLSTNRDVTESLFTLSWATSAATAQVARMAALISAEYPQFWPETVRALIVHSARWTPAMLSQMHGKNKRDRGTLIRRYGFGVPDMSRALRSATDALTLVIQGTIRPFEDGRMGEMHFYELPWPADVLKDLGETPVHLRVCLSYFIEPNPGSRGWKSRYRYASHGLRFGLKLPLETTDVFRKRLNRQALEEDEKRPKGIQDDDWVVGDQTRNKGSLHCDIWDGTAASLAQRNVIGIYPVSGWWKEQPKRDRSSAGARYSLVVSIEVDAEEVDVWTPVAHQIGVPVEAVPLDY